MAARMTNRRSFSPARSGRSLPDRRRIQAREQHQHRRDADDSIDRDQRVHRPEHGQILQRVMRFGEAQDVARDQQAPMLAVHQQDGLRG